MQHPGVIKKIKPKPSQKAVADAVQAKLAINAPGDEYEQEADAMAAHVMALPSRSMFPSSLHNTSHTNKTVPGTRMIMRKDGFASTGLMSKLNTAKGGGATMPGDTLDFMEGAFSADFSTVRIHADARADEMSRSIHAKAFTHGNDIYFRDGFYNPHSATGRELLAHELTHVLQQSEAEEVTGIQRRMMPGVATEQSAAQPVKKVQEIIDRLNTQSGAISYSINLKNLVYKIVDESALTAFDLQLRRLIDRRELTVFRLLDRFGLLDNVEDSDVQNKKEYGDVNYLLNADDKAFQYLLIQTITGETIVKIDKADANKSVVPGLPGEQLQGIPEAGKIPEEENIIEQKVEVVEPGAPTIVAGDVTEPGEETGETTGEAKSGDKKTSAALLSREPSIPEPPSDLGPEAKKRMGGVTSSAKKTAGKTSSMPSEKDIAADAQKGVTEPEVESQAKAGAALAAELNNRPEPSPEIEELCNEIRRVIHAKKPPDEDSLLKANLEEPAEQVGNELSGSISDDTEKVKGEYKEFEEKPEAVPGQQGIEPVPQPVEVDSTISTASKAAPDPVPDENISLDKDVENSSAAIDEAGMNTKVSELIEDPDNPVTKARAAQGELETTAAADPASVMAKQQESLANAQAGMDDLQAQALKALKSSRTKTIDGTSDQQVALIGTEEQKRAAVGKRAEQIFVDAQTQVKNLLDPLPKKAMDKWNAAKTQFKSEFKQHLARVQSWVDDRHSGVGGFFVSIGDYFTGLPSWVNDEYDKAEIAFADSVCNKIREISAEVNGVIATCEEIINHADTDIKNVFEKAKAELGDWVVQEQARFAERITGLRNQVQETRKSFEKDLAGQAAQAVQEVREEVHALREAAKGLIGRIADAIDEFLDDPLKFIINGLLSLVGISPPSFWALVDKIAEVITYIAEDPMDFASKLMDGVGNGFEQFFDNFGTHLLNGMVKWLFSGLGAMGIQVPAELSLPNIISFFLQLMGFSWQRIRKMLAKHIGEENVELLEQAFNIIAELVKKGPLGVFEWIEDQLDPEAILDQILEAAMEFLVEKIAEEAAKKLLLMFIPGGAILVAIEAIYKVLKWIFQNAAKLFAFIEAVVNGMMDIVKGNIAAMANSVEMALAELLVPVIDFIAEFFSLGALPEKVADVVRGMQEMVAGLLDRVIGFLAKTAKEVMAKLGFGKKKEEGAPKQEGDKKLDDSEVGKTIRFQAGSESHKLWIKTSGAGVEVMMSSTPTTVNNQLSHWRNDVNNLSEDKKAKGLGLINSAEQQNAVVMQQGAEAEKEIKEAKEKPEPAEISQAQQADNNVESAEQTLKNFLSELIELLGDESLAAKYRSQLEQVDEAASKDIVAELQENGKEYAKQDSWEGVINTMKTGGRVKHLYEKPLGTSDHNHAFGKYNFNEQALPALDQAMAKDPVKKEEDLGDTKLKYAQLRKGVIHGAGAPEGEQQSLSARQDALRALQQQLFIGAGRAASLAALVEYFYKSLQGHTAHKEYAPENINSTINNGALIVGYDYGDKAERTGGKRDFVVSIKLDEVSGNIVVQSIDGNNLALKVPGTRGYTASAGAFGDDINKGGVDIQSAHLLADQFMGSGYKSGLNLLLTSAKFNTEIMREAESQIVNQIKKFQLDNKEKLVTFNMRVKATSETLGDDPVITLLKGILPSATKDMTPESLDKLAEETRKLLSSKQDPKRCKKVEYTAGVFADGQFLGTARSVTSQEDVWVDPK